MTGQKFSEDKLPIYTLVCQQFPLAIQEVAKSTLGGHQKYLSTDQNWDNFSKVPNPQFQYLNAAMRHLMEAENHTFNEDMKEYGKIRHRAQAIWNLMASLEMELRGEKPLKNPWLESIENQYREKMKELNTKGVENLAWMGNTSSSNGLVDKIQPKDTPQQENVPKWLIANGENTPYEEYLPKFVTEEIAEKWGSLYFQRPTLSVDQLVNREDYPDFKNDDSI